MEIASRVVPVLPFSICCVWTQEFCRQAGEGFTQSKTKGWKREESGGKRKDWGKKSTFEMEKELSRREGRRKGKQCHSLSSHTGAIQSQSLEWWLGGNGWLFPVSPNWTALTSTQCSLTPTTQPPAPAAPLFHSCLPSGTLSHPFFSQGDIPKVQNLEAGTGERGSDGQQVPARPLSPRPQTLHLPSVFPTPPLLPEHKQSLSNQNRGCLLQLAPERQI